MKFLLGAAAVAVMFAAAPAVAQTPSAPNPNCTGFTPPPALFDGATGTAEQVTTSRDAAVAWAEARVAKLNLCRADIEALRAQLNELETAYNTNATELNTTVETLRVEVEEYNARTESRGNRRNR